MSEERFHSVAEVAGLLQVDIQTVRRWIKTGRLSAYKPGLEWRIRHDDLEEFLQETSHPKAQSRLPFEASSEEVSEGERRPVELSGSMGAVGEVRGDLLAGFDQIFDAIVEEMRGKLADEDVAELEASRPAAKRRVLERAEQ